MMMNLATKTLVATIALSVVAINDAATHVAVIDFGKVGSIQRSNGNSKPSTVQGVESFWSAVHGGSSGRKVQQQQRAGMDIVPDLFNKPDSGVIIAVKGNGVDLHAMPYLSKLVFDEKSQAVGVIEIAGSNVDGLMSNVDKEEIVHGSIVEATKRHAGQKGLSGVIIDVDVKSPARDVDRKIATAVDEIKRMTGLNIVVHVVVDDNETVSRRYSRRLEEVQADGADADAADYTNSSKYSGYYGYGYYNDNGEWVTPYKTMFQIQYFNVVLWTSVGLFLVLCYSIYLMVNMPLEADTLLFGESGKYVADD